MSLLLFFIIIIIIHYFSTPILSSPSGEWHLLHENIGISAMHMQLLNNDNLVIFDRTDFGPSNLSLPDGRCRYVPRDTPPVKDCTAHSVIYDVRTNRFRPLTVRSDTWCSSGAVLPNGTLVQTGGFNDGDRAVRSLTPCHVEGCDWVEFPQRLLQRRWYASNQILPDGRIIIVGGRFEFNYEIYVAETHSTKLRRFNFLHETLDKHENNLYPFLHLLPDGKLFVFANRKSVTLDYKRNRIVRRFPEIPGGESRNYPSPGSSVLLPIDENAANLTVEVMICGGASHNAIEFARKGTFLRASSTCGRLRISDEQPEWEMEKMPMARVMSDMLLLPNGDVIIINGAGSGSAGWEFARNPVTVPLIYRPSNMSYSRFATMAAAVRPRLYHSTAVLLSDGRVLVGGSNPHVYYNFTGVDYPTDLSLEAFSPPYLSRDFDSLRPRIMRVGDGEILRYKKRFSVIFRVGEYREKSGVSVRIVAPSFNTHSFSMNQRMVVLKGSLGISCVGNDTYRVEAFGLSTREMAPPGYYMLFIVHVDVPSLGVWVRIQ